MDKKGSAKFRRKFYSLYLDTMTVLVLFLLLVLVVWLSMRPTPVLEAKQMGDKLATLSKSQREALKSKFVVRFISAPELTDVNNPELVAFGTNIEGEMKNPVLYYSENGLGLSLMPPRHELDNLDFSQFILKDVYEYNYLLKITKPELSIGSALNMTSKTDEVQALEKVQGNILKVHWNLPDEVPMSSMPNIEQLMRKYGWLSGSLDVMLTVGNEGFVSNVIVYSEDMVNSKLLRELKGKLLTLHLGKKNANKALSIGVSWNLP